MKRKLHTKSLMKTLTINASKVSLKYLKENKVVVALVFVALMLRLLKLNQNMTFTADEAYLSYITKTIIEDFHVIWIGWSALGFDLYLGPYWIYIMYPLLLISRGDPLILGVFASLMGGATTFLLYWTGKEYFSKSVGIIASILYATLPLVIFYDQKPYPPGVPLLSMIITISLLLINKSPKWWLLFFVSYAATFHIHLSLILIGFVGFYLLITERKFSKSLVLQSTIVILIMFAPLLVFDYYHKASNITAPLRALHMIGNSETSMSEKIPIHLQSFSNFLGRLFYLNPGNNVSDEIIPNCTDSSASSQTIPNDFVSLVGVLLYAIYILNPQSWINRSRRILLLSSLTFVIPYLIFTFINPIEYYLLGFIPLYLLILGIVVQQANKLLRLTLYVSIVIVIIISIHTNFSNKNEFGLETKKILIQEVSSYLGDEPFYLMASGECQQVGGWRYLFSIYGKTPTRSTDDKTFGWLYPSELSDEEVAYTVDIHEARVKEMKSTYEKVIEIGGYRAYIHNH